jgi:multiple sugar transport system substrate-binding protein
MKRIAVVLVLFGALLAACGGAPTAPQSAATSAPAGDAGPTAAPAIAAGEKITLRIWSHQNQSFNTVNQQIVDKFMAQNPNIEVKYETFPYDQFIETIQTSMASGTEADVIEMFGTWVCSYARGGRLLEVPPDVMTYAQAESLYFKAPLDGYNCDGKLYGLPNEFNLENSGVLVNPALFEKHGVAYPPKWSSFADLIADAKKLTESDGTTMTRAGFHYTGGDGIPFAFLAGILQQGGSYFAADGTHFNFDTPEARKIAQLLVDMAQKDKLVDSVLFNSTTNPVVDAFFQGNVAIGFVGSWAAGEGRAKFPEMKFDYVAIPPYFGDKQIFAADSGWGKVVPAHTKHAAEAWKLARFMAAEQENALAFNSNTGTIPAMKALVENPDKLLAAAPWIKPTFELLPHGAFMGDVGDRDQLFYEIIYKHIIDATQGLVSVDEAVKLIQTEANAMRDAKK